ncbi:polysaccharide deacetylase family protein [Malonomonas rubra]|nr:polysaccharide deacetylase family protein [Malonomonas rubra]
MKSLRLWLVLPLCVLLFAEVASAGQANVFIYHRFDENRYPSTNISTEIFAEQLAYLKQENYQVLSFGEVVRRIQQGESLPEKAAALCADDAYQSFADGAMPIVREYGYPITLFVNTDAVGSSGYLDWQTIKGLHAEGVGIENHTASHPYMVEMEEGESFAAWRERIKKDILKSQQAFSQQLGYQPKSIAYTFGEYSDEVIGLVKELGFESAFAQQSGVVHDKNDLFTLPRFPMGGPYATLKGFIDKLKMKPLVVLQQEPVSPLIYKENPPELLLQLETADVDMGRVNCFVQGENSCTVAAVIGRPGWYRVIAEQPLSGRRNKYTLTVPGKKGGWHWFSQPWVNAERPALQSSLDVKKGSAAAFQADVGKAGEAVTADQ